MDDQKFWQWVATACAGVASMTAGWIATNVWSRVRNNESRITAAEREMYEHKLYASEHYARRTDVQDGFAEMKGILKDIHTEFKDIHTELRKKADK